MIGRPTAASLPRAVRITLDVQHELDGAHHLTRERAVVEPGERAERLEPRGHVVQAVRVQGARSAVVPGVEGGEQLAHLFAAALPDDEPVGSHAQRLAHESGEPDPAGALEVGLARLEPHVVRVVDAQLGDVLDRDDPLVGAAQPSSAASSVVLPAPAAPVTSRFSRRATAPSSQRAQPPRRTCPAPASAARSGRSRRGTRIEITVPVGRDRRQHGVHADAVLEPHVDARGQASSRCRPPSAISATASSRTSSSAARHSGARTAPRPRSTNSPAAPLTKRSVTSGSSR